jgi:hypothetical protein
VIATLINVTPSWSLLAAMLSAAIAPPALVA